MNTKNNQRYRQTEQRIMEVFSEMVSKKEIQEITVREICEAAQINRTTFYMHFQDVYDLMNQIEHQLMSISGQIFSEPTPDYNLHDRFVTFFGFIEQHKDFFRAYLSNRQEIHVLDGSLSNKALHRYQDLTVRLGYENERELQYHNAFFKAGLTALVREWIQGGCVETTKELADILAREYQPTIHQFVQNF